MASHKINGLLKYGLPVLLSFLLIVYVMGKFHHADSTKNANQDNSIKKTASEDSAAESLDTLTASLSETKKQIQHITDDNEKLNIQNKDLLQKLQVSDSLNKQNINQEIDSLKKQILSFGHKANSITPVQEPATNQTSDNQAILHGLDTRKREIRETSESSEQKPKPIPYYTIPANSTAVDDKLMTSLVGRIPVKGVVTDPYPFKIVFSDDTLAASGWRVPHLRQMIVAGFTEGDLNLLSVRGWVTSLSFIFDDGRVFNTTSNNNDIGHFDKSNALGYLSDEHGNPFFQGKLISNAPSYLAGNVALGATQGAANAYAQSQTTNSTSLLGSTTSIVTGSVGKFVLGQSGVNAANQVQQWWHDREENSFDAIYVPSGEKIVVNFAKEIDIDYNPVGRMIDYAQSQDANMQSHLD
jgi:hypothetical protein